MTAQEMIAKQWELVQLIEQLERLFVVHQFDKYEKDEEVRINKLNKVNEEKRQLLAGIKALIDGGVHLDFKHRPVLDAQLLPTVLNWLNCLLQPVFPLLKRTKSDYCMMLQKRAQKT